MTSLPPDAQAQRTWQNRSAGATWNGTGLGWSPDWWDSPNNDTLVFANLGSGNVTNNTGEWARNVSIVFNSGAASFTQLGDSINVLGKIENNSANTQTISLNNISANNAAKELNPVNGNLVINSANLFTGGSSGEWRVYGTNGFTLTINGVVAEAGGLSIQQNSTVVFQKTNTYTGQTYIHHGQLIISNGARAGTGTINLGGTNILGASATNALYLGVASSSGGMTNTNAISVNTGGGASTIGGNNTSSTNEFSGSITLNQGVTFRTASGGTLTLSGTLGGAGGFTNSGTIVFSGSTNNTASGGSTISSGTTVFNKSANTAAIAGALTISTGATLRTDAANQMNNQLVTVNGIFNMNSTSQQFALAGSGTLQLGSANLTNTNTGTDTFGGKIEGTGNLVKDGVGVLVLTNTTSDFAGTTTINGGLLTINNDRALGAVPGSPVANEITIGAARFGMDGTFTLGANRGIVLSNSASTIDTYGGGTGTVAGIISGTGTHALNKAGTGTLILSGANSYTGATTISNGAIRAANATAFGTTAGGVNVLSGAAAELSGGITIGAESITLNGDGIGSGGSLRNISGDNTWQGGISNNNGARINVDSGTLTISGNISNTTTTTLFVGGVSNSTFSGTLTGALGSGNGALFKDGVGTLTLGGNNASTLSGNIILRAGTVRATNGGALGTGTIQVGNSATTTTLLIETNGTRSGAITISNASSAGVINVGTGNNFTNTGGLTQTGGTDNTTKFGKDGAGTLVLGGTGTYGGQIQVGQGTIVAATSTAFGTNSSTTARGIDLGLNVGDTATANNVAVLAANGVTISNSIFVAANTSSATRTVGISGSGSATFNNEFFMTGNLIFDAGSSATDLVTMSGNLVSGGAVTKTNAGILLLSGAGNTFSGGMTLGSGTLRVAQNSALGTGTFTINGGTFASDGGTARTITNVVSMGGNVTLGDATGTGALTFSNVNLNQAARTFTVGNTTTIAGVISNGGVTAAGLTKAGAGTLILTNANTYSGTTTLSAGTLRGGNNASFGTGGLTLDGGTLASDSATARTFANNVTMGGNVTLGEAATGTGDLTLSGTVGLGGAGRTFTINNNSTTLSGIVSNGGLTKAGTGTLTLTAANSYTSGTLISAGTLQLGSGSTTGTLSTGNITNNATFLINRSDSITLNNIVSGTGALNKTGAGTLTLGGVNTYTGKTTISNGAVNVSAASGLGGNPGATAADQITLNGGRLNVTTGFTANGNAGITLGASGGTIDVGTSQSMIQGGGLSGSGALTKTGAGTLALTNTAGNYSGAITLSGGGLKVNTSLGSASVTATNASSKGSVLSGAGTLGAVTIGSGGLIAPGNSLGTLSVSSLTMNGGGGYEWEVTDAAGVAGTGWDVVNVGGGTGTVTIGANSGSQFTIYITGNNPSNFNSASNYTWAFINSGTISGFAADAFATDTSGFTGYSGSLGSFAVSTNVSGDLTLVYTGASSSYDVSVGANTAANQGSAQATNSVALFTGAVALNKLGAGTLIMTNPLNDYSGLTTIKQGTIQINTNAASGAAGALGNASGAVLVGDSATNLAAGFNLGVASITNFRALTMVTGTGSASRILSTTIASGTAEQQGNVALNTNTVFSAASGGTLLVSGIVSGSGALTISNGGTTVLSGANTYTNTTTVVSGATLIAANNTAFGTADAGTTVNSGGRVILSNNISTSEAFNITGTGISSSGALQSTGTNTITGAVVLGGNTTISNISGDLTLGTITGTGFALTFNAGGGTNTIASLNTSTGGSLTKNSGGILIITGASDYTGGTTTTSGTLRVGNNLSLGTGTVTVNGNLTLTSTDATDRNLANNFTLSSGTLSLGTGTTFTGNMTISGSVNLAGATKTISVAGGSPATISGAITNGGLTKAGAGTLTLAGANTYSGGTTISAGRLAGSTVSLQGAITNNSDILFTQTTNGTYSGAMSGTGTVVKDGSGTVTFSGANDFSGATTISNGTLALGNATALGTTAAGTTIASGASLDLNGQTIGAEAVTLRGQGVSSAGGIINTSATDASLSGAITLDLATSSIGTSAGNITLSGAIGETGGSRALVKVGTGTVILSGANTYTGATTISNGTVVAANNTALGTTGAATTVVDGATLAFSNGINSAEAITINGAGAGSNGALRNLSGANTNTGTVTVNSTSGNRIQVDSGSSLTLGAVAHTSATRNLTVSANGTLTVTGAFTGGGTNTIIQKDGTGAMIVSNTGTTSLSQMQIGAGSVTIAAGSYSVSTNRDVRALDLGISSAGDSATNTAFYASSGVTISNSIYVAPQVGGLGTRTIGTESSSGTVTYNNQMYLGNNATVLLTSAGTANLVYSGNITNDSTGGIVTKVGAGTLTLSGVNTWAGQFIAGAGTTILNGGITDTNAVTISNGATLRLGAGETVGSITGGGNIELTSNQLIAGQNNSDTVFSGIMSSTATNATFVKKGSGVLTLSGANTMNGQLYLVAGNTLFTTNQGVGFTNIVNLGEDLGGTDNVTLTLGGTGVTLSNLVNVRSGSSNNTMLIASSNASGTSLLAGGITLNRAATLSAQGGGALVVSNAVTLGQSQLRVTNAANSAVTIVGNISSTNRTSGELLIDGPGTTTITGNNSADMKITLGSGTLVVGALTNLGDPTGTFFNDKLNFNGGTLSVTNDITTGGNFGVTMSGNGGTVLVTSGKTFKISDFINGSTNTTYTFGIGGGGTLVLRDSGENFFANTTTFAVTNNSTLQTANTLALGLAGNTALVSLNAGTFSYTSNNATMSQRFTVGASGGTINVSTAGQALTLTNSVTFTGDLTKTGGGILEISGAKTGTGNTAVNGGVLRINNASSLGTGTGTVSVANGATLEITNGINSARSLNLSGNGTVSGALLSIGGINTNSGGITLGAASTIGVSAGSLLVSGNITNAGNRLTLDTYGLAGTPMTISGIISGNGGLTKIGGGTAVLTGANTYTNSTLIGVGTLQVGAGSTAGQLGTGAVTISNGATLNFNRSDAITANNAIDGAGNLIKSGASTLTLGGANTYSGGTLISAGTLAGSTLSIQGSISNSGALLFDQSTNGAYNGIISGVGSLAKTNSGEVTLTGANTFSGGVTVNGGTLILDRTGGAALGGTNAVTINNGGTLRTDKAGQIVGAPLVTVNTGGTYNLNGNDQTNALSGAGNVSLGAGTLSISNTGNDTFSGVASGAGGLTKIGSGAQTLSGANDYTGATTITAGDLALGADNVIGDSSAVTVNGGTFTLGARAETVASLTMSSGSVSRGGGILTLNGASSMTGGTVSYTAAGGSLIFGSSLELGNVTFSYGSASTPSGTQDTIRLGGDIGYASSATGQALFTNTAAGVGAFDLGAAQRTLNITNSGTLASSTPEMAVYWTLRDGGITKDGTGALLLGRANTHTNTTLTTGDLLVGNDAAVGAGTVNLNGGTFASVDATARTITNALGIGGDVTLGQASGGTGVLTFSNANLGGASRNINAAVNANFIGAVTNGSLVKSGNATLALSNTGTSLANLNITAGTVAVQTNASVGGLAGSGTGALSLAGGTLTVNASTNSSFGQAITGAGGLTKTGAGTMTLTASNNFAGATLIGGGTLAVNGTNTGSAVTISNTGTLGGTGLVGATTVKSGGFISPGNSIGTLAVETLTLEGGGGYVWEVANVSGSAGTDYDLISVGGGTGATTITATSGSPFTIYLTSYTGFTNWTSSSNYSWNVIDWGSVSGFDSSAFTVNTNSFSGSITGAFTFANTNGFLVMTYTAGTPTYNGGAGTWSEGFNPALANGNNAEFTGAGGNATNNISTNTVSSIGALTFSNTAGAYTLSADSGSAGFDTASRLLVSGNIVNNSASAQTINLALGFDAQRTIDASAGNMVFGGTMSNGVGLIFTGASNNTVSGVISGVGTIAKTGNGTLVLSGANDYTGATIISNGVLQLGNAAALGTTAAGTTVVSGATLDLNGQAVGAEALSLAGTGVGGNGSLINSSASASSLSGAVTLADNSTIGTTGNMTLSGAVGGAFSLTKTGAATLNLSAANGYSGGTVVNSGAVMAGNNTSFGSGTITINGGGIGSTNSRTIANNLVAGGDFFMGGSTTTYGGGFDLGGTTRIVTFSNSATFNGVIANGGLTINAAGLGQDITLAASNTYTGATTINGGDVVLSGAGSLSSSSAVNILASAGNARFDISGITAGSTTIGSLAAASSADATVNLGSKTLIAGGDNTSTTFGGVISNAGSLVKTGTGTMTFTRANTYTGATTISNGEIALTGSGDIANSSALNLAGATARFDISGKTAAGETNGSLAGVAGSVVNLGSKNLNVGGDNTSTAFAGVISNTGSLTKSGTGTMTLSGANTFSGGSTLSAGVLRVNSTGALGTGALTQVDGTSTLQVNAGGTITNNMSVYNVEFVNGGNTLSGTLTQNNTTYDVNAGETNNLDGFLTGSGGVTLIGGGQLNLTGTTNNYTGNTVISNGTLQISTLANSNTVSSIGVSNNVTLAGANATNAVLDYTGGNVTTDRTFVLTNGGGTISMASNTTNTLTGSASGTGTLIVGEGTLVLSNGTANSFAPGSIQVDSGATLQLAANDQIGNTTGLILNGGTFRIGTASTGFSDTLGTLTLSASSTIDLGAWTTGVRQLTFANSSAITWTGTLTITNWQGVALQSSSVAEIIFGTGGLTSGQLAQVSWANQGISGGTLIGGELVPVPEPRVYAAAVALIAVVGWRERKRLLGLLRRKR